MQNTIQKFWQSSVVLRNQVFCLKIWKVSRALTILQFDIFCWNFAHVFYLLMSTIECVGFLKVYLDLELFGKIRKDLVSTHSFFTLLSITQDLNKIKKKSHTSEGGVHLRISFWHLLINLENPKKSEFWKNEKIAGYIIILHMCTKNHNHMWYSSWDTEWDNIFLSFWTIFCPLTLLTQKIKFLQK